MHASSLFVWGAFISLHTCRTIDGGPIPWVAIERYASRYGLQNSALEDLEYHLVKLDNRYLALMEEKRKAKRGNR